MLTREDGRFVGSIEVRNVKRDHRLTDDELLRLLRISGLPFDGSHFKLTADDVLYLCMLVRFNFARECQERDELFDDSMFNHLYVVH
jgi:hypothetical protein